MRAVKTQVAIAQVQQLVSSVSDKCFAKCVPPHAGSALNSAEQKCLTHCIDRYIEVWNLVSKTFVARVQREQAGAGLGGLGDK